MIAFFLALLTIALFLTIYGLTKPKKAFVFRSIHLESTPDKVFEYVTDFKKFVLWSPWSEKDPNMEQMFDGAPMVVGSKYSWKGNNKVGVGSMEITKMIPNQHVEMNLNFGPRGKAKCCFDINPYNTGVLLTWSFTSEESNNPLSRIFFSMFDKFIGKDFESGLSKLSKML